MKRKDINFIVLVAVVAGLFSIVISSIIFGSSSSRRENVPVANSISSDFPDTQNDSRYTSFFNSKALDPTQLIQIGNSSNKQPFSGNQ